MKNILYVTVNEQNYKSKYQSQIDVWKDMGYKCNFINLEFNFKSFLLFKQNLKDVDIVYFRHEYFLDTIWIFIVVLLRNKKIIIEIPTPISTYVKEVEFYIKSNNKISWHKVLKFKIILNLGLACILKRANLIIEMATEKYSIVNYFKNKIFLWQNGINSTGIYGLTDVHIKQQKCQIQKFINNRVFNLIIVANLVNVHGLDRILRGLSAYLSSTSVEYKITVDVISSETIELNVIKEMVKELKLTQYINFHGFVSIVDLANFYVQANFAIGPVGLHRVDLESGSPLKLREYSLMGLPSCINYYDYDLSETEFAITLPRTDDLIDINSLIKYYTELVDKYNDSLSQVIHDYAINNFLWKHKVANLQKELLDRGVL